jgi:cell division ATPase FtsA
MEVIVMADGNHIRCADIEKLVQFEKDSQVAKTDFDNIIKEFKRINEGAGANQYRKEVEHILEKIGSVGEVLDAINEGAVKSARDAYLQLDADLAAFNENPTSEEGGN